MKHLRLSVCLAIFLFFSDSQLKGQDYCEASGLPGTTSDIITRVQLYDINHGSGKTAYSDFTNISTELARGGNYDIKVYLGTVFDLDTAYVWIDYDHDFVFEPEEFTKMDPFVGLVSSGVVEVPTDATLGATRMRVRGVYNSGMVNIEPCGDYFGEVEDYTIVIIEGGCATVDEPCDDGKDCTSDDFIDFNCNCRGTTFDDEDLDGVCDAEDRCPGQDDHIDDNNNGIPDGCEDYCVADGSSGTGADWISRVRLYDMVHSSLQSGYSDFTMDTEVTLAIGGNYDLYVHLNAVFPQDTAYAWIDFNQDFIFQASEQIAMSEYDFDDISSGSFTVPADATVGPTRMRVRNIWSNSAVNFPQCNSYFGEVEDFTVVIADIPCPAKGTPCDDGLACSTNDVIDDNCQCRGEILDDDFDGVCNEDDECPGQDDNADLNQNGIVDCKDYCLATGAASTGNEFITKFVFDGLETNSGKSSYSDFTDTIYTLERGESTMIEIHLSDVTSEDQALVWIDLNQNRIFEEEEQMITLPYEDTISSGIIDLPFEAEVGPTLMRVRNITGFQVDPCGSYAGEVEDYTINITGTVDTKDLNKSTFIVFPNPATESLSVKWVQSGSTFEKLNIYNLSGVLVEQIDIDSNVKTISVANYQKGMYFVSATTVEGENTPIQKVVIH